MTDWAFMTHTATLWSRGGASVLAAATTLRKLCANILDAPGQLKYRRVRCSKLDGLLDEGLLVHCGFSRLEYPDGLYWVMHSVDVKLLRAVLRELDLGIDVAQRHLATKTDAIRAAEHCAEPPAPLATVAAEVRAATTPPPPADKPALATREVPSLECQLRARNAAHKLLGSSSPGHRNMRHVYPIRHWVLAATVLLVVGAAVATGASQ